MIRTLFFATHNKNKSAEIAHQLKGKFQLKDLHDLDLKEEIPETGSTLNENAMIKARFLFNKTGSACFADDSGLLVDALDGAPGIYSKRYAGEQATADDNNVKLLANLREHDNRSAHFKTVIAYINAHGMEFYFEGEIRGTIEKEYSGNKGFGYDPIFKPEGKEQTFAQMNADEKNAISHRGRAVTKFIDFLNNQ